MGYSATAIVHEANACQHLPTMDAAAALNLSSLAAFRKDRAKGRYELIRHAIKSSDPHQWKILSQYLLGLGDDVTECVWDYFYSHCPRDTPEMAAHVAFHGSPPGFILSKASKLWLERISQH